MAARYATKNLFDAMNQPDLPPGRVIRVAADTGADSEFDYLLPDGMGSIAPGQRVEVPFGKNNKLVAAIQPPKSHIINSSACVSTMPPPG